MILYFSGTGNSRYVADYIASIINDEVVSLNDLIKKGEKGKFNSTKPFVFVTPTYAWRTPRIVTQFLSEAEFEGNHNYYFVFTCADSSGRAKDYVDKTLNLKSMISLGYYDVIMPEGYIAMYNAPSEDESKVIINNANPNIEKIANDIKNNKVLEAKSISIVDRIYSDIVNPIFYKFFVKSERFYVTDKCINCGKCVKICPMNNISIMNERPEWKHQCTHCMACISTCPTQAIEYEGASENKRRYYNKGFKSKE